MVNKVVICGVETSKLKVLKEKEKMELLRKYRIEKDIKAREKLINGNLKLVLSVVRKFSNRGENLDDIFQVGCMGLIKSIDNFNMDMNVRFSTYAVPMILGEIRRYLRDYNSIKVTRSMRDTAYKAMKAKEVLINRNLREPTIEEIAQEIDLKKRDIVIALESIVEPVSIFEPIYSDSGDTMYVMDQLGDLNDDKNWLSEISIKEEIKKLSNREKSILELRFYKGKTQMEVAEEIGISQAQVSRLEKNAIEKIKR
ncbi:MAG: RNA polymerase sporulation sigma factor SigG [Oscillospiraceae bacterium]